MTHYCLMNRDRTVARSRGTAALRASRVKWPAGKRFNAAQLAKRLTEALNDAASEAVDVEGTQHNLATTEERAAWLGVAKKTLERWRAESSSPRAEELHMIAQRTGVSIDWLLDFPGATQYRVESVPVTNLPEALRELLIDDLSAGPEDAAILEAQLQSGRLLLARVVSLVRVAVRRELQRARLERAQLLTKAYARQLSKNKALNVQARREPSLIRRAYMGPRPPDPAIIDEAMRLTRRVITDERAVPGRLLGGVKGTKR